MIASCAKTLSLHADTQEIAELDLGDVVANVLIVLERRVTDMCVTGGLGDVRLGESPEVSHKYANDGGQEDIPS
jgi:hypothetical protein